MRWFKKGSMHDSRPDQKPVPVEYLKLNIPLSPPLSPNDIANIITSVSNLAMNRGQIPTEYIELTIMGASDSSTGTQNPQDQIDKVTETIKQSTADLQDAVDKEKGS